MPRPVWTSSEVRDLPPGWKSAWIGKADLGYWWPLTVRKGILSCRENAVMGADADKVVFTAGGQTYGVNGWGSTVPAATDIRPIWADAPGGKLAPPKKNIGPLIAWGLALCQVS